MMETVRMLMKVFYILSACLTLVGLIWPWYALWWSPRQNRLMVIKYYGLTSLVLYVLWRLTDY